jgi:hypothetical protein
MHLRRTSLGLICGSLTVSAASTSQTTKPSCSSIGDVLITFYGYPDNSPPGATIAYTCPITSSSQKRHTVSEASHKNNNGYWGNYEHSSQNQRPSPEGQQCSQPHRYNKRWGQKTTPTAGGVGTYADPLTMASSNDVLDECQIYYLPYLQKYLIFSDECEQCEEDADDGIIHIDIWTGSTTLNGGQKQIKCEEALTPDENHYLVKNPPTNLPVNSMCSPLFLFY